MSDLFEQGRRTGRSVQQAQDAARNAARDAHDRRVIAIRGAREHNLKGIDVEIPRDKLIVFTGLSGSGKSSLAFDTIYACLLYTSPSPRDGLLSRMPSSA